MSSTVVMVFAKAPRPGEVKTRLIPLLGADGAAALHARLVAHALATARAAALGRLELHCAPDATDPFFGFCRRHYGAVLAPQAEGGLGARMAAAFAAALAVYPRALLIGTDCPALGARHLREAEDALLGGCDAVLGPAEDGGYVLIGLTRTDARLYDGIAWGGDGVLAETRTRLRALGWRWHELETLWDVDRPDDYERLLKSGILDAKLAAGTQFEREKESQ
ncbi:MAG: glycosyltransferase [Betaproteobacteria bacterium]|nr:glycosyltransferase [Betaproteobacteria bacterium]